MFEEQETNELNEITQAWCIDFKYNYRPYVIKDIALGHLFIVDFNFSKWYLTHDIP